MPSPTYTVGGSSAATRDPSLPSGARRALMRGRRRRPDDVAEHSARLDRRQLPRVADEDEPRLAGAPPRPASPSARARPSTSRRRSRRRGAAGCRGGGGSGCGCPGRQPSSRCSVDALKREQLRTDAGRRRRARAPRVHRLLEPRGRLAGRRREGDERRAARGGLLGQQRDDPRDGRRLAGARPAGDDREAPQDRGRGGQPLAARPSRRRTAARARRRGAPRDVSAALAERPQVRRDWRSSRQ